MPALEKEMNFQVEYKSSVTGECKRQVVSTREFADALARGYTLAHDPNVTAYTRLYKMSANNTTLYALREGGTVCAMVCGIIEPVTAKRVWEVREYWSNHLLGTYNHSAHARARAKKYCTREGRPPHEEEIVCGKYHEFWYYLHDTPPDAGNSVICFAELVQNGEKEDL